MQSPKTRREGNVLVKFFSHFIKTSRSEEHFHGYYTYTHTHISCVQLSRKKSEYTEHFFPLFKALSFLQSALIPSTSLIHRNKRTTHWLGSQALHLTSCVTLSKSLKFSELEFPLWQIGKMV